MAKTMEKFGSNISKNKLLYLKEVVLLTSLQVSSKLEYSLLRPCLIWVFLNWNLKDILSYLK